MHKDGKEKRSSSRRREYRVMRRTCRTPQSRRDEAHLSPPQADYEAIRDNEREGNWPW